MEWLLLGGGFYLLFSLPLHSRHVSFIQVVIMWSLWAWRSRLKLKDTRSASETNFLPQQRILIRKCTLLYNFSLRKRKPFWLV